MSLQHILTVAVAVAALAAPAPALAKPAHESAPQGATPVTIELTQDLRSPDTVPVAPVTTQDLRSPDAMDGRFVDVPVGSPSAGSARGDSIEWPLVGLGSAAGLLLVSLAGSWLVSRRRTIAVR